MCWLWLNVLAPWLQFWWKSKVGRQNAQKKQKFVKNIELSKTKPKKHEKR
jgi:hypothetical protein